MRVEKLTLKKIFIIILTALSFLIVLGALCVPLLAYYHVGISDGFYILYHKLCVGSSARCFTINGCAMPLCARCLGLYTGIFLTLMLYLEQFKINKNVYYLMGILGIGEVLLEYFNLIFPNIWITFCGGLFVGIFLAVMFLRLEIKFKHDY